MNSTLQQEHSANVEIFCNVTFVTVVLGRYCQRKARSYFPIVFSVPTWTLSIKVNC